MEAETEGEGAYLARWFAGARLFLYELLPVASQPDVQLVVRILLGIGKQHREVIRYSLVNPLVVVARPCHDVSPPLMCHFVIRNQLGVVLLSGRAQSRALLGFGRQKGVDRKSTRLNSSH